MTWAWPPIADGCSSLHHRPPCGHGRNICGGIASSGGSENVVHFRRSHQSTEPGHGLPLGPVGKCEAAAKADGKNFQKATLEPSGAKHSTSPESSYHHDHQNNMRMKTFWRRAILPFMQVRTSSFHRVLAATVAAFGQSADHHPGRDEEPPSVMRK